MSVSYDENEKKKQYKIKSVTAAIQIGQTKSGTGTTNLYTFRSIFWETCLSRVKLQSEKTKSDFCISEPRNDDAPHYSKYWTREN